MRKESISLVIFILFLSSFTCSAKEFTCPNSTYSEVRLPKALSPTVYDLLIHPNVSSGVLKGTLAISIEVINSTDSIVLHANSLNLLNHSVFLENEPIDSEFHECKKCFWWLFRLPKEAKEGEKIELHLNYTGLIGNYSLPHQNGVYFTQRNFKRSVTTHFEPNFARTAFPSFDEPSFKAEFQLSVLREERFVVRSNTKLKKSRKVDDSLFLDEFHTTPKMSTYLLAFTILDDYEFISQTTKKTSRPIEIRIYVPSTLNGRLYKFSLETAVKAMEYFEEYFDIPYPLDKIDFIFVELPVGAMENWGMVTVREDHINSTRFFVTTEICHEVVHQWFGNLVTMEWWNDIWLNEGFARFFEYDCAGHILPDFDMKFNFYYHTTLVALKVDARLSTRPISSISENVPLTAMFDSVAYDKAAVVINMIQTWMGEENFRQGLTEYLRNFSDGNAVGDQLWEVMDRHSLHLDKEMSVGKLAKAYTRQPGYPLIRVSRDSSGQLTISNQTRFFLYDDDKNELDNTEWPLPLVIHHQNGSHKLWLHGKERITWQPPNGTDWMIVNSGGGGFCRVIYDEEMYGAIANQLKENHTVIDKVDRIMIIRETADMGIISNMLNVSHFLEISEYAHDETRSQVWIQILFPFSFLKDFIADTAFIDDFKEFAREIISPRFDQLISGQENAVKNLIVDVACELGVEECKYWTRQLFDEQMAKVQKGDLYPHALRAAFEQGVAHGGKEEWESVYSTFINKKYLYQKYYLLPLALTKDPELINRLLEMTLNDTIDGRLVIPIFDYLSKNDVARPLAWSFFKEHYEEFHEKLSSSRIYACLNHVTRLFNSQERKLEVLQFAEAKNISSFKLRGTIDLIEKNIDWLRVHEDSLKKWTEKRKRRN